MLTKEELVDLLINDVEAFNKAVSSDDYDLSETDLSNLTIEGAIFNNVDLTSSSFSDSQLTDVKFINCDLTSVDFTRTKIIECNFSESILNGADFSYSTVNYCGFPDSDMAGAIVMETDLSNSDFSMSENMSACRYDDTTVWPDSEYLPEDFDASYTDDLSSLKDEDDYEPSDY